MLLCCTAVAAALGSLMCGWFFFVFYWRHRGDFNEAGRYFDPHEAVVYHQQN